MILIISIILAYFIFRNPAVSEFISHLGSLRYLGILIASPLPDEAGVIMLAGLTKIKSNVFAILSFSLNTAGILILLLI